MIGDAFWEYIYIRASIFLLHYIAPLSVLYCSIVFLFKPDSYRLPWIIEYWIAAESAFFFLVYLPYNHYLQEAATHPTPISREQRSELFNLCHRNVPDPEIYLTRWFMGAPASEIKRENVKEFFAWAFLGKAHFDAADEDELEDYVERMESLLGRKMNAGKGRAMCLRLTIDKIDMLHRSLVWYFCVFFVDTLTSLRMLNNSFHFHRTSFSRLFTLFPPRPFHSLSRHHSPAKHLTYWHRPHTSNTKLPILFIHGIGIGLYPYVNFLIELNQGVDIDEKDADVGIIAIEIMPVSFRITHGALEKDKMCEEIQQILQKHGWGRFVLVSHSYGSVISTHLLQTPKIANNVGPVLLIDPVAFLLHLPDVAFNFTCRKPQRANEYQLWYFASKDMGVAHTLSRHFFWSENILWRHDLEGRRVTVSLAGRDLIVNTDAVGRYLTGNDVGVQIKDGAGGDDTWKDRQWKGTGLDVLWFSKLDHAQIFDSKLDRGRMISVLAEYCKME